MRKQMAIICLLFFVSFTTAAVDVEAYTFTEADLKLSAHTEKDFVNDSEVSIKTEYKIYAKDIQNISLFITNKSKYSIEYGVGYEVEMYLNGRWYETPEQFGYDAYGISQMPGSTRYDKIYLGGSRINYPKGEYRIVKELDKKFYQAKFTLGDKTLGTKNPYGFEPLEKLPANYTRKEAVTAGDIVITKEGVINNDKLAEFLNKVNIGAPAMLRITNVENLHKPSVIDIIYDDYYLVRKADLATAVNSETAYSYLNTDGRRLYLSNYATRVLDLANKNTADLEIPLYIESTEGKEALAKTKELMDSRTQKNITRFKVYSPDRISNASLSAEPMKLGFSKENEDGYTGKSIDIVDSLGIANKITEIEWLSDTKFMITCVTSETKKYFAVYNIVLDNPELIFSQYSISAPRNVWS